jgi:hypothetical protein
MTGWSGRIHPSRSFETSSSHDRARRRGLASQARGCEALGNSLRMRDQPQRELEDRYLRVTRRARRVTQVLIYEGPEAYYETTTRRVANRCGMACESSSRLAFRRRAFMSSSDRLSRSSRTPRPRLGVATPSLFRKR